MYIILYLLGVMVATYLIGRAVYRNPEGNIECSGFILCYCFAILSWLIVFIMLFGKLFRYLESSKSRRFSINLNN
jgi:hypothetical protein